MIGGSKYVEMRDRIWVIYLNEEIYLDHHLQVLQKFIVWYFLIYFCSELFYFLMLYGLYRNQKYTVNIN